MLAPSSARRAPFLGPRRGGQARKELRAGLSPRSQFHQPPLGAPSVPQGLRVQLGCPPSTIPPTARASREPRKGPFLWAQLVQASPRRPRGSGLPLRGLMVVTGLSAQRRGGGDQQLVWTLPRHWSACSPPLAAGGARPALLGPAGLASFRSLQDHFRSPLLNPSLPRLHSRAAAELSSSISAAAPKPAEQERASAEAPAKPGLASEPPPPPAASEPANHGLALSSEGGRT